MDSVQEKNCGTCCAWNIGHGSVERGECRKAPPTTHGWPKTTAQDWCIDGWKKNGKVLPASIKPKVKQIAACGLAFNYRYILDYPKSACKWLSGVFEQTDVPEQIKRMLDGLNESEMMSEDDCDGLLCWANKLPGFCENEDDDKRYMSILIYTDIESDNESSMQAKAVLPDSHQFFELLRKSRLTN